MSRRVPLVALLAALLAGCGLLLGTTEDPYVDPSLSIPPAPEGGEATAPPDAGVDAGRDALVGADVQDAAEEDAGEVDPDV